jgi:RND family efflux transporter MFP subunit
MSGDHRPKGGILRRLLTGVLPVLVLTVGVTLAVILVRTSPRSTPRPPQRTARLVEVLPVEMKAQSTALQAFGTVRPAREVTVYPRVAGEIIDISPSLIPGGRFDGGEMLLTIDPIDFQLQVRQRQADVAAARANLSLEMGQQAVALREYELLGETISEENRDLVLRKPQLAQAQATLSASESALDLAELDLERTTVTAPFNATVRTRNVNKGMQVSTVTELVTVTGSDEYWVELTLPVSQLKWVRVPRHEQEEGSRVHIRSQASTGEAGHRDGVILRLLPDLEPDGRLARLLVSVMDPLALLPKNAGKPPLILGDYVSAEIVGIGLPRAVSLDRRFFRDGDYVWLMNADHQLELRPVEVAFRSVDTLLVTAGLDTGEKVITTDLPAAVEGMALRTVQDPLPEEPRTGGGAPGGGPRP